jgi:hypothetical protein
MSKGIVAVTGILGVILFVLISGSSREPHFTSVRMIFYNVENFFDIYDDTLTQDDDFLPGGVMRWNYARYKRKINSIYKTIIAAGEWDPPDIVALCETENKKVLQDLLYETNLYRFDYGIIHEDSPDERGIDVSLMYRKERIKILYYKYLIPSEKDGNIFTSRSVLYAKCQIHNDTLHLFVNHWPSRRGGVLAGEHERIRISDLLKSNIDSIAKRTSSGVKIVIAGDLNCNPDDHVIKYLTTISDTGIKLRNLSDRLNKQGLGSYRYLGTWEMIDQVIISDLLYNSNAGLSADSSSFSIFKPDFLLKDDPKFPGLKPFSTYYGYSYQGGFSDHLPVLLDLKIK